MSMIRIEPDGRRWIAHAPGSDLDYSVDWSAWMAAGETIVNSAWTATAGITMSRSTVLGGTLAVAFAAGGVAGQEYVLTNTIATSEGRVDSRTITLRCRPR
jgi:hypothetical protein